MNRFSLVIAVLASGLVGFTPCWGQEQAKNDPPLVWVLSTGGTIAGASSTNLAEYKGGTILGEQLVKEISTLDEYKTIIRCLHPDANPSTATKNEAFRLFNVTKSL
jgi:L-asparaginase/Glu-tRNA(Gln) amidotransferase subunit D